MTPTLTIGVLGAALVAVALGGPWLLRRASSALAHVPRLAVAILAAGSLAWVLAALALGPLAAWAFTGPAIPGRAGEVCRQCLDAANPWTGSTLINTWVPAIVLLALPTLAAMGLLTATTARAWRHAQATRAVATEIRDKASRTHLQGQPVLLIPDPAPLVFTLAARHGGVVVSTGARERLDQEELAAVLEHERAHLRQHHHLVMAVMRALIPYLRWVPLIASAAAAIPHYLEIAADDAARRRTGTRALATALLKVGEPASSTSLPADLGGALGAAGPHRIGHLVRPTARAERWPALFLGSQVMLMLLATSAVGLPYAGAVASGCF
ncbi:M56 family metallopeptidase [Pseudactinotalea sp. Z1748]|uniref:M56 family metallopeptidase n=1 Tax=Pseudactinotalea sp. Z1748 TaxID=3413027 RepID=UPI003C7D78F2